MTDHDPKSTFETPKLKRDVEEIASIVIDVAFQLHRDLGPGLLEPVYEVLIAKILAERGLKVERQKLVKDGLERVVNNHKNFASSRLRIHQKENGGHEEK